MLVLTFFRWWYGAGWMLAAQNLENRLRSISQAFSVRLLLRTLFSPWRRIVFVGKRGFDGAIHAAIDNGVGRLIGFSVRCVVLLAAGVAVVFTALIGGLVLLLWPLLPPLAIFLFVVGCSR